MIDDWDWQARQFGFKDEKDMWEGFYVLEEKSISMLALILHVGTATVSRRLDLHGVVKRPKGGDNNPGQQTFKLSHLDQRIVLVLPLDLLADITNISRSLWYKYRKQRGEPDGLLYLESCGRLGEVRHIIDSSLGAGTYRQSDLHPILPADEEGR